MSEEKNIPQRRGMASKYKDDITKTIDKKEDKKATEEKKKEDPVMIFEPKKTTFIKRLCYIIIEIAVVIFLIYAIYFIAMKINPTATTTYIENLKNACGEALRNFRNL